MSKTDISQWEVLSKRPGSSNYISPDRKWMVKTIISSHDNDLEIMKDEQKLSDNVLALGIPTPKNDGIIELEGNEYGIVYEFIDGKESLSRAISRDISKMDACMEKFEELRQTIHCTECDTDKFVDVEDKLKERLARIDILSDDDKMTIIEFMDKTPKATTCLHGDFHPGNFITAPSGDYVIDLGNFCYGNPLYDWGHWYFMSHFLPEDIIEAVFHVNKETVQKYWSLSLEHAFGATDDNAKAEVEKRIIPYVIFSVISFFEEKPVGEEMMKVMKNASGLFE